MSAILILENDPVVMLYMRRLLKHYTVIEATTAEEALRLFENCNRRVDLLVANLTLPTSSGIEVALSLRSELPALPVILTIGFLSADGSRRNSADLGRLGSEFVSIIEKPIQPPVFLNTVNRLLTAFLEEVAETA